MMCNRSYNVLSVATDIATIEDTRGKHVSGIQKRKYCLHNYLKMKYLFILSWILVFHSSMKYCIIQYYSFQLAVNLFVQSTLWYSTGIESNYRTLLPTPYPGMGSTPHSRPTCCPEVFTIHQTNNVKKYPRYPESVLTDFPGQENKT